MMTINKKEETFVFQPKRHKIEQEKTRRTSLQTMQKLIYDRV